MNPLLAIKLVIAIGALAGSFWLGMRVDTASWQSRELKLQAQIQEQTKKAEDIAADYEVLKSSKTEAAKVITRDVYHETFSNPGYACVIPDRGMQLLTSAISAANSSGSIGQLPGNTKQ